MQPRSGSLLAYLLCLVMVVALKAEAANWRTSAGLSNELVYTDNVDLSPDDEQGGLTWRITPNISLNGEGRRLQLNFNYAPSYLQRFYRGGDSDFVQNLSANLSSELYEDVLFLDARANAGLTLVNPFVGDPGDGINQTDNTRQSFSLSISPYVLKHFGSYADLRLGYSYSNVWTDGFSNSEGHAANFSFTSGRRFQIIDWGIDGSFQKTEYQGGDDSIFGNVTGRVGYAFNRKWRANVYVGYDDNDFLNLAGELDESDSNDGFAYGGGFTWNPSPRTSLDVAVANRYFGTNLYFDFSHRSRRSVWTASLTHEPNNARNETLNQQTFQNTDAFGDPIPDPSGELVFIDPDSPLLTTADYIRGQFKLGYAYAMRRGGLGLNAYYTERDYADDRRDTAGYGVSASLSHRLLAHVSGDLGINWSRNTVKNDDPESTSWTFRAGLNRQLSARTNLSLGLRHQRQESDEPSNEYTENRITLNLATSW